MKLFIQTYRMIFTVLVTVSMLLFSSYGIEAGENSLVESLKLEPLSRKTSAPTPAISQRNGMDLRINDIEAALKGSLSELGSKTTGKTEICNQLKPETQPGDTRVEQLQRELQHGSKKEIQIHFRTYAGTPRQIKMNSEAKRKGVVLERTATISGTQQVRDETTARAFLRSWRGMLKISDPDRELRVIKYQKDDLGRRLVRYTQTWQGLNVWPAELNVHLDENGNVDLMNGSFVPTPRRMVAKPVWTADEALEQARSVITGGSNAEFEETELIIYAPEDRSPRLAWKIQLIISPEAVWLIVIDAANGRTLTAFNQVPSLSAYGSGIDLFGYTRPLNIWEANGYYFMVDTSKPMFDPASDFPPVETINGAIMVSDLENKESQNTLIYPDPAISLQPNIGWLPDAVSLAYNLSETYDYYLERHNRNSLNGKGGTIQGFVRYGYNYDNACWWQNAVFFGDAQPYAGLLDVVAHECTHGVTSFTCGLVYENQSGALNEAFSDIFGAMVEHHTFGSTDWVHGEDRSLYDPSSLEIIPGYGFYYPSKMSEFYSPNHPLLQLFEKQDNGGVHFNNTIVSHCFYLLAEGLPEAIGIRDAERVFYRAQTVHLVSGSQFVDMRLACITSAEELFGADSNQVAKVAEAFDAVEIVESTATPAPPPLPAVSGDESAIFIREDGGYFFLARYENDLGDDASGAWLSCYDVNTARPSVSGDGSLLFFVDSINDACFIETDGSDCESCLELPEYIHSVAMSADKQVYGFVLLEDDEPTNAITVIDLRPGGSTRTFPLVAPTTGGGDFNAIWFADSMCFTPDNRYLIYDAYNEINYQDGTSIGVWSIYAIDLLTEQTIPLVGPFTDADVGYPSLGRTLSNLMTFDLVDLEAGNTYVIAYNLDNGENDSVAVIEGTWTVPGYNGDDSAILYSCPDPYAATGYSYIRQPLGSNQLTPSGSPELFISDANFGVTYRRGNYETPVQDIAVSSADLSFGNVSVGSTSSLSLTVSNIGSANLMIYNISLSGVDHADYHVRSGCSGQQLVPSGEGHVFVDFLPNAAGETNATLVVESDDTDQPSLNIALSGTGVDGTDPEAEEDEEGKKPLLPFFGGGGDGGLCFIQVASGQ